MKERKIGIWAPLRYANVGDDMQALAFALYIKQMGRDIKVFQLENCLAKEYGFESSPDIDALCENTKLVIIAGGALLTPFRWYKRILNRAAREYEKDFKDLIEATRKYPKVKFCAISMGGDGKVKKAEKWYSKYRIRFFKSDSFINGTVRLAGDAEQMRISFGKQFKFYPDMLFRQKDFFDAEMLPKTNKFRVVLQFKKGRYIDKELLSDIYEYAEKNDNLEFHFITTHMKKIGLTYQYMPKHQSNNIFLDYYENPNQLMGVLASADLIITSMLHVGLLGLTMGTPFVSYRGPGKTKSFLKSIGGDWAILDDSITFSELTRNFFSKTREELYCQYDVFRIEEMKKNSVKHYEFCKSIIEEYG